MVITRQNRSIIIEANDSVNMEAVQRVIDYINILEILPLTPICDRVLHLLAFATRSENQASTIKKKYQYHICIK